MQYPALVYIKEEPLPGYYFEINFRHSDGNYQKGIVYLGFLKDFYVLFNLLDKMTNLKEHYVEEVISEIPETALTQMMLATRDNSFGYVTSFETKWIDSDGNTHRIEKLKEK